MGAYFEGAGESVLFEHHFGLHRSFCSCFLKKTAASTGFQQPRTKLNLSP